MQPVNYKCLIDNASINSSPSLLPESIFDSLTPIALIQTVSLGYFLFFQISIYPFKHVIETKLREGYN